MTGAGNDPIATAAQLLLFACYETIIICAVVLATAFAPDTLGTPGDPQSIAASRGDAVQLASAYRAPSGIGLAV